MLIRLGKSPYLKKNFSRRWLGGIPRDPSNFDHIIDSHQSSSSHNSVLPFNENRRGDTFGKVMGPEDSAIIQETSGQTRSEEYLGTEEYHTQMSTFRNPDGSFVRGSTAQEARLDPKTLDAKVDQSIIKLPPLLAKTINQNILANVIPSKLRQRASEIFVNLDKELIQKAPSLSLDVDAHIAALFLQNYSHAKRVLKELKKREGANFNPQAVLDIGYGPATGMLALNELMGDDFNPAIKDVYVVGRSNKEMKKRAKILLSRQLCEVPDDGSATSDMEQTQKIASEADSYVGPVDTSKIKIKTNIRDALASTKRYDLIMVNQALLTREYNFPRDVDVNLEMILGLLLPGGHLVLIERGNTLGFEIIARARQVMLRPESYKSERGRIPRPYIRGSSVKPQSLRHEDLIITEAHIEYERQLLAELDAEELEELKEMDEEDRLAEMEKMERRGETEKLEALRVLMNAELDGDISDFEAEITREHGEVTAEDLKFEFEDDPNFEVIPVEAADSNEVPGSAGLINTAADVLAQPNTSNSVDYHLSVIAPCPHHGECPLQLGDPKYYKIPNHKHRFNFCSFDQVVERPRYTMELKKGKLLATTWDKRSHDGFGFDRVSKSVLKDLEGSGRRNGSNAELGNFSYLIMKREKNDPETIRKIELLRQHHYENDILGDLPRVIEFPTKIKNNVKLKMCAPSGNIEVWQVPKSLGKQTYHDARKVQQGDLWALGKKAVIVKNKFGGEKLDQLKRLASANNKFARKEKQKKRTKKVVSVLEDRFEDPFEIYDEVATSLEQSKKYRTQGRRANYDVDLASYDGR